MQHFNQSPKYPLRWSAIRRVFTNSRLKEKWNKKVRYDVRRGFYPDIIDYTDFHSNLDESIDRIRSSIEEGTYSPKNAARYRVEKSRGLCRLMVAPHPEELLVLQSLSDILYHQLKAAAPSKNAFFEPSDHSFSKLSGKEPEYGTFESWKKFLDKILGFQKDSKFVIVTDIANYYDFIDFNSLRNVLSSRKQVNESLMDFLIYILRNLSWQPDFMPFRSNGLPQIDTDAPRLLAHAYLFELDAFVESINKRRYARFMDDIDAGVDTISEAKSLLRDIDLVLQSRNLRLNSGKTKILSAHEALDHFRVKQNSNLNVIEEMLTRANPSDLSRHTARLDKTTLRMIERKKFDEGNGEKILKRIIGIQTRTDHQISDAIFHDVIFRRPNLRTSTFGNAERCGYGRKQTDAVLDYMRQGLVCDDAFQMTFCKSIVAGKLIYDGAEKIRLRALLKEFDKNTPSGIHSTLWFLSRFGRPETFFQFCEKLSLSPSLHPFTSRLIGGFIGRIIDETHNVHRLRVLVSKMRDRGAEVAFEYVYDLHVDPKKVDKIYQTLNSRNPSSAHGCTHAKFILLHAVLHNKSLKASKILALRKTHDVILKEPSYASRGLI